LRKWVGYVDKFVLFPQKLKRLVQANVASDRKTIFHILDHSNSLYLRQLQDVPHLITCNDLIAVRSALGEFPQHVTRWSGRKLQSLILTSLSLAKRVVAVSQATANDVVRLAGVRQEQVKIIHMGQNRDYGSLEQAIAMRRLNTLQNRRELPSPLPPYLLHVGGNQWYKNRLGALTIFRHLITLGESALHLILAGEDLSEVQHTFIQENHLQDRVHVVVNCDDHTLQALYSLAQVLLFPSFIEGFGWPLIEAQVCGCPVMTTQKAPMTDVAGDSAWYINPDQPQSAAQVLTQALQEPAAARQRRIASGYANAQRFSTEKMLREYVALYQQIGHPKL
jgi:glycosyltransferase involved in cell wall biosynthesis